MTTNNPFGPAWGELRAWLTTRVAETHGPEPALPSWSAVLDAMNKLEKAHPPAPAPTLERAQAAGGK